MKPAESTPPSPWERVTDLALACALVMVPLAFHTGVREFGVFKLLVFASSVGLSLVALALSRASIPRRGLILLIPVAHVLAVLAWRPGFAAANQAMALLSPLVLAWMLSVRLARWPTRRIALLLAVPLTINLGWSLVQGIDVGVLPATASAFGTTHGVAVGAIGNPNENCWYLLLASTLLAGLAPTERPRKAAWLVPLAFALVAVVVLDRSRAVMLAATAGLATWLALSPFARPRLARLLGAGVVITAIVVGSGLAWGGIEAVAGRAYLADIELPMLVERLGFAAGLGSFSPAFATAQAAHLAAHPEQIQFFSRLDHAHNDLVELAYELGAPALVWMLAITAAIWRSHRQATRLQRAAVVCLVEGFVLSLFGYPLFSPASALVLALALALALGANVPAPRCHRASWAARASMLLLGAALTIVSARRYQSERGVTQTLQALHDGDVQRARVLARAAERAWPVR